MPKGSHTAFARADVEDAKRGAPATDLAAFAARRGLEPMGSVLIGAFTGILPDWPDYTFNVSRGVLDGGRFGLVEHELYEIDLENDGDLSMDGSFFGTATRNRFSLGRLAGIEKAPKNEAFAADAAWAPSTAVVLRVPETALLPRVVIRRSQNLGLVDNPDLSDDGAPGFRMVGSRFVDDDLRSRLVRGVVAETLTVLTSAFVELELDRGALALRVNGFVSDDGELDCLTAAAAQVADAWTEAARPAWSGADLGSPLPAPDPSSYPPGFPTPTEEWRDAYGRVATELSLTPEDPAALHRAAPRLPVPGTVDAVLRGPIGGGATIGRLLWTSQGGRTSGSVRGAVWFPARAGAATSVGGVLHPPTDMYAEVVDGSAWCWSRLRSSGRLDSGPLGQRAVQTVAELGLVAT
jgi:hypothetical protein